MMFLSKLVLMSIIIFAHINYYEWYAWIVTGTMFGLVLFITSAAELIRINRYNALLNRAYP